MDYIPWERTFCCECNEFNIRKPLVNQHRHQTTDLVETQHVIFKYKSDLQMMCKMMTDENIVHKINNTQLQKLEPPNMMK